MAALTGADVGQLRALAGRVMAGADHLDQIRAALAPSIDATTWRGPSAERLRRDWHDQLVPGLNSAAAALREASVSLRRNAEEQQMASSAGGLTAADSPGTIAADERPTGGDQPATAGHDGGDARWGVGDWFNAGKTTVRGFLGLKKAKFMVDTLRILTALDLASDVHRAAASAKVILPGQMVNTALGRSGFIARMLSKFGPVGTTITRWMGPIGGIFAVAGGISDMVNPQHEGWRGVGDRIAGGLSVVGGAGVMALALGAGAALGPVGVAAIVGAGAIAGAWALGNLAWDNRESIAAGGRWLVDRAGEVAEGVASDFADAWGDIRSGAGHVGSWIGGLFS